MSRCIAAMVVLLLVATLFQQVAGAQVPRAPEQVETERIVVMIRARIGGDDRIGAGLLVGAADGRLYVATANHVVRQGAEDATNITVELRSRPGELVPAVLAPLFDARADIAVLVVRIPRELGVDSAAFAFDRLGEPASLRQRDGVFALGQPQGRRWGMNVTPFAVSDVSDSLIAFEATSVAEGHSGGALLNDRSEIVGLLLDVSPPEARARSITNVLALVQGWGFPVALTTRFRASNLDALSAGAGFTCALTRSGAPYCWGANEHGQLGNSSRLHAPSPSRVATSLRFASITAGDNFACGLSVAGIAYCWGNAEIDWMIGPYADSVGPVPGNRMTRRAPAKVLGAHVFRSISAGSEHTCAVATSAELYCWGENDEGQLGNGSKARSVVPVRVAFDERVRSVTAGSFHSCALTVDGRAFCWGAGWSGRLGTGTEVGSLHPRPVAGSLRFTQLSAGGSATCGVASSGLAYCWGNNEYGQLGDSTEGELRSALTPRAVVGSHRFQSVSVARGSRDFVCGVTVVGAAYCWGWESEHLGQRELADPGVPGAVIGDASYRTVSAGVGHACGRATDGVIWCWGSNDYGQLGDGSKETRITPSVVPLVP